MTITHIGKPWQHHIASEHNLILRQIDHHVTAGVRAAGMVQLNLAAAIIHYLKQGHL